MYDRLVQIAPDGDVAELLKQAVEKLISEMSCIVSASLLESRWKGV